MKHSFYVRLEIDPDDGEISRESLYTRLQSVLEHSTVVEALSSGLQASVRIESFSEGPLREELIEQAVADVDGNVDVQIDADAAVSLCPDENYDWVMAWLAVYRDE